MRKTISSNTEDLIRKSQDEINDIINMTINKIVTEQKIEKLIKKLKNIAEKKCFKD